MKILYQTTLLLLLLLLYGPLFSQDKISADSLVKQGIELGHQGKYVEAIAKFNDALKIAPSNMEAEYEMGYNLYVSGDGKAAIPHLEKVIKEKPDNGASYDMLGTIYDDDKQTKKAIETYQRGIKASPDYQRLYFNLGIAYLGQKNYTEAEVNALYAVKLDPAHASSHRLYAMATYNRSKRICAIIGLCNFLLIEPKTNRSVAVFKSLQMMLKEGVSRTDEKSINLNFSGGDDEFSAADLMISFTAAKSLTDQKDMTPYQVFEAQITSVITITGELSEKKTSFFWKYYADYFYKLSKSGNMPAFVRLISVSAFKDENEKWLNDNPGKIEALNKWVADTNRN